jgi:hypothetical protein
VEARTTSTNSLPLPSASSDASTSSWPTAASCARPPSPACRRATSTA